jgi:photosystem II oxygen-evolving enhancer protein 3
VCIAKASTPEKAMSRDKMQALLAMLVGFGVGCAVIYVGGGQTADLPAPVNMASLSSPQMLQPTPMKFLQPSRGALTRATPEQSTDRELALERRELMNAAAFAVAASFAGAASALSPIDLRNDQKARSTGFDIIYEARDGELPENTRQGYSQARSSISDTKARVQGIKNLMTKDMPPLIKKAYWTQAKEKLRLQVGTLRFDLNTLAAQKPKAEKKSALAANKEFIVSAEKLDFAIRQKNMADAEKAYAQTMSAFDAALKGL